MAVQNEWDLKAFASRIGEMDLEAFLRRYPAPFLLVQGVSQGSGGAFQTGRVNIAPAAEGDGATSAGPGDAPERLAMLVKSERNAFRDMISIGRAGNNDVVLDHHAVSKLHAFFRARPDGAGWSVTDAGSTCGTMLDGLKLPPNKPHPLKTGQSIIFGNAVWSLYLSPEGLYEHIQSLRFFKKI